MINLLTLDIPESQKPPVGFLEIINKQYHENINSSIYAYFINCEETGVSDLFIGALTELIQEKSGKNLSFGKAIARCEVKTEKGRLDILITDRMGDDCILIENKIFHWLHNDLLDYWNHAKVKESKKIGVLLTPEKHPIPLGVKDLFINITHSEWIRRVLEKGLPGDISSRYHIYINDFANTIENLTKSYLMNEQTKFYFENASQILKVQQTIHSAHRFLNDQLQLIADTLGLENYGNSMEWRNFWDAKNSIDTFITVIPGPLLRGEMRYQIILELYREDKKRYLEVENLLKDDPQYKQTRRGDSKGLYMHFGTRTYTISAYELEHFAQTVVSKIREDFGSVLLKTIHFLYPNFIHKSAWDLNFSQELNPSNN